MNGAPASRIGRPSKLSPERRQRLLEARQAGATRTQQAEAAGVGRSTLLQWLRDNPDLAREDSEAEQHLAELMAGVIVRAAVDDGDWRAAGWWLERRARDRWAKDRREPEGRELVIEIVRRHATTEQCHS